MLSLDHGDHPVLAIANGLTTLVVPGIVAFGFRSAGKRRSTVVKAFAITATFMLITYIIRRAAGGGPYS